MQARAFAGPMATTVIQRCQEAPRWQSLGDSNPSFQVENLTS